MRRSTGLKAEISDAHEEDDDDTDAKIPDHKKIATLTPFSKLTTRQQYTALPVDDPDSAAPLLSDDRHRIHLVTYPHYAQMNYKSVNEDATFLERYWAGEFTVVPEGNRFLDGWDTLVIMSLLYTAVALPVQEGFFIDTPSLLVAFNAVIDCIFVGDILVTFQVAYTVCHSLTQDLYERMPAKIAKHYMGVPCTGDYTAGWFWLDILTVVPWHQIGSQSMSIRLLRVLRLLRMARLVRVIKLADRWHSRLGMSYALLNVSKCAGITLACLHWLTCIWGFFGMQATRGLTRDSWIVGYCDRDSIHGSYLNFSVLDVYNLAMYFCVMTLTGVGFGDVTPIGASEVCLSTCTMWGTGFLWAWVLANMVNIVQSFDAFHSHYQELCDDMNQLMTTRQLPQTLRMRVRKHLHESFKIHRARHQQANVRVLSTGLQGEIALESGAGTVCNCIPYLRNLDPDVMMELVNFFMPNMYSPAEFIIHKHSVSVVRRGSCWYKNRILTRDDVIGEDMLLDSDHLRENVFPKTLNYVEDVALSRGDLCTVCDKFPEFSRKVRLAQIRMAVRRSIIFHARRANGKTLGGLVFPQKKNNIRFCQEQDKLNEVIYTMNIIRRNLEQLLVGVGAPVPQVARDDDDDDVSERSGEETRIVPLSLQLSAIALRQEALKDLLERSLGSSGKDAAVMRRCKTLGAVSTVSRASIKEEPPHAHQDADASGGLRLPVVPASGCVIGGLLAPLDRGLQASLDTVARSLHERLDKLEARSSTQSQQFDGWCALLSARLADAGTSPAGSAAPATRPDARAGAAALGIAAAVVEPSEACFKGSATAFASAARSATELSLLQAAGDQHGGSALDDIWGASHAPLRPTPCAVRVAGSAGASAAAMLWSEDAAEALSRRLEDLLQSILGEQRRVLCGELARHESKLDALQERLKADVHAAPGSRPTLPTKRISPLDGWTFGAADARQTGMDVQMEADQTRLISLVRCRSLHLENALTSQLADLAVTLRHRAEAQMESLRESMSSLMRHQGDALQASLAVQLGAMEAACCRLAQQHSPVHSPTAGSNPAAVFRGRAELTSSTIATFLTQ